MDEVPPPEVEPPALPPEPKPKVPLLSDPPPGINPDEALPQLSEVVPITEISGPKEKLVWGGIAVPLFNFNAQDGLGFGAGGEVYARPKSWTEGYRIKLTLQLFATLGFRYTSNHFWFDINLGKVQFLGRVGYRGWRNSLYAGVGGEDVANDWGPREGRNGLQSPVGYVGVFVPVVGQKVKVYGQVYAHGLWSRPNPRGLLDERAPFGAEGGFYGDVTGGLEWNTVDRWPMPKKGLRGEVDLRVGLGRDRYRVEPLVGAHAEAFGWWTFWDRLTFGGRMVVEKSAGERPFFEQDSTGGRWRDELGMEQTFTGYGRWRTRGDGLVAAMVEVRPELYHARHKVFDTSFHLSAFGELGWLFKGGDIGPVLPTIGGGPEILFRGAIQARPFIAVGWQTDVPGGPRHPSLQYGISFLDPL